MATENSKKNTKQQKRFSGALHPRPPEFKKTAAVATEKEKHLVPIGFVFSPGDEMLIQILCLMILYKKLPPSLPEDTIVHENVYQQNPEVLLAKYCGGDSDRKEHYFFAKLEPLHTSGSGGRPRRTAGGGTWKSQGKKKIHDDKREIIGYKTSLAYFVGKSKTPWLMTEYRLKDYQVQIHPENNKDNELVICKIYETPRSTKDGHQNNSDPPASDLYKNSVHRSDDDPIDLDLDLQPPGSKRVLLPHRLLKEKEHQRNPNMPQEGCDFDEGGCSWEDRGEAQVEEVVMVDRDHVDAAADEDKDHDDDGDKGNVSARDNRSNTSGEEGGGGM